MIVLACGVMSLNSEQDAGLNHTEYETVDNGVLEVNYGGVGESLRERQPLSCPFGQV